MTAPITLWIPVWGDYIDMLDRYALPSIVDELPEKTRVVLCSVAADAARAAQTVRRHLGEAVEIEHVNGQDQGASAAFRSALAHKQRLLICPPDNIFGQGSISNLLALSDLYPGTTIAAAHLRVDMDALMSLPYKRRTNRELVSLAHELSHQCFSSTSCKKDNSTFMGGISYADWSNGACLIHQLPTPWLLSPRKADEEYFREHSFGYFDHEWPSKLVQENRLLVPGSTDIFFAVELTKTGSNNVPIQPGSLGKKDFHCNNLHNLACASFLIHFVGESK